MNISTSRRITLEEIELITGKPSSFEAFREEVLEDYYIACLSRATSVAMRKEVLTGKAKFAVGADGKELPQIILSKFFQNGDFRSGYYRDGTWMLASGMANVKHLLAQLYANPNPDEEPLAAGRQMTGHYATRMIDEHGAWTNLTQSKNSIGCVSSTAGQMARSVGLAQASKQFRNRTDLGNYSNLSNNGDEVVFVTIGDASTSEGVFWETINAAGVLKVPLAVFVWDDGYGISVPTNLQTTKGSISEALKGFEINGKGEGFHIHTVYGWDYPSIYQAFREGIAQTRQSHEPVFFHVKELTQPQGHSTSGSHERYKSKERMQFEKDYDGIHHMRSWLLNNGLALEGDLQEVEASAKQQLKKSKKAAWKAYSQPIQQDMQTVVGLLDKLEKQVANRAAVSAVKQKLQTTLNPFRKDIAEAVRRLLFTLVKENVPAKRDLMVWKTQFQAKNQNLYSSHFFSNSAKSPLKIAVIPAQYKDNAPLVNGYEVLNACFDAALARDTRVVIFGEDVGHIGDVNQGLANMQHKYGKQRVFDTGIRELTILGQGTGLAMRGLRPIAEIQYIDYFIYGLQTVVDDLSCLRYRTAGKQAAPLIIRTRGHRLEGIWHTGSPMAMLLNSVRGVHLLVPRNMVQASGFYNTMLLSDDPAIIVECLNGYRLKEKMPANIGTFTVPLGIPETLRTGQDVSIVTYGTCCRIAMKAADTLAKMGIDCEVIDVQTLLPFDRFHHIKKSVQKTNRVLFFDEDVPGGATAFMLQQVVEVQEAYYYLDAKPATLTATAHRTPYGSDGDYYSKPNMEDVVEKVYEIMHEADPMSFPAL
ncbi:MAG: alpha-ketoacid dehydrogenase subunit alpha/beta [Chitinophagales bacterium]